MNEEDKAIVTSSGGSPVSANDNGVVNSTSDPIKKFMEMNRISTGSRGDLVSLPTPASYIGSQTSVGLDATRGDRKYLDANVDTSSADFREIQAQSQSVGRKALHGLARIPVKVVAEIAKMPGYIVGGVMALGAEEGTKMDTFVNNAWVRGIGDLNESINDGVLPVYVTNAAKNGNLIDNISSMGFWATEGADGIGFILSMFAPGAVFNSLKLGSSLTRGIAAVGSEADKINRAVSLATKLGVTGKNIDTGIITLANTIFESAAEAGGAMQGLEGDYSDIVLNRVKQISGDTERAFKLGNIDEETYNKEMSEHYAQANEYYNEQKGRLGSNIFKANMAILMGPNLLQTQLLYSGVSKGMLRTATDMTTKPNAWKEFGKGAATGIISEGFWEEGMQTTVENMFSKSAFKGELTDSILTSFNVAELIDSYGETLSSTDGQKAILLGAVFGGLMNGVGSMKSAKNKYEQALLSSSVVGSGLSEQFDALQALYKRDDRTSEIVRDSKGNPVLNDNALSQLGSQIASSEVIGALYNEILSGSNFGNSSASELFEIVQGYAASGLAYGYAQTPGVAEDMFKQHANEYIEAINNDTTLSETQKRDAIEIAEKTNKLVKKQLDTMLAISEVYDDLSPFNNADRNKIKGTNKDQQFQNMYNSLRREFMLNQGNIVFLESIKDKLETQLEQLNNALNRTLNRNALLPNSTIIEEGGEEIRAKRISNINLVRGKVEDKLKSVENKLNEFNKLNEDKYFNEEYIQNHINRVAENNAKIAETKKKEAEYSRLLEDIKNAETLEELKKIKVNDPLYKESFEAHKEARRQELENEKKTAENIERTTVTEREKETSEKVKALEEIDKVPFEIAESHALEAITINNDFVDLDGNSTEQQLKAFSYFFSKSSVADIEAFIDMIIDEGYDSVSEYIEDQLADLNEAKEATTQPSSVVGEEYQPTESEEEVTTEEEEELGDSAEEVEEEVETTTTEDVPTDNLNQTDNSLESQKADIERRRQEELNNVDLIPLVSDEELARHDGEGKDNILRKRNEKEQKEKEINAKYDAELESLGEVIVEPTVHTPEDVGQEASNTPSETAVLNEIPDDISQDEVSERDQRGTRIADREITSDEQMLPRLIMSPNAPKVVEFFTKPVKKIGKLLKLKIFEIREETNPNYSMSDRAVEIYNNSVKGKKFDMSAILAVHRYEREKKVALNKIKSDNPDFDTLTSEVIKRYDSLIAKVIQGSKGSRDFRLEDFEILVKHLPISVILENDLYSRLDHLADDVDKMKAYNERSGQQALRLRIQIIDALMTGNIDKVTVSIEKQLRGDLMLDYTEDFRNNIPNADKYNYNNVGDLKMFEEMSEDQKIQYVINNLYYDTGVDVVKTNDGITKLQLSGAGFKGSIYLTIPTANGVDRMPVRLSQGKFTAEDANAILNITRAILETGVNVNEMTVQEYLNRLEEEDSVYLYDLIKPYADMATHIHGTPTLSQMMNLYLHNSNNDNSRFMFSYTNLEVGGLFYKGGSEASQKAMAKLGGEFTLTVESLDDPDIEQAFLEYIQKIRKNIKVKDPSNENAQFLTDPVYVDFLLKQGHLKTNIRTDVQAMGNSGRSSRTEALLSNSLKNEDGSNYKMSFNPQGLFDLPLDVTNGLYTESAIDNKRNREVRRKEVVELNKKVQETAKKPSVIESLEEDVKNSEIAEEDVKDLVKEVAKTSDKLLDRFKKLNTEDKYSYVDKILAENKSLYKGNIKKLFESVENLDKNDDNSLVTIMTSIVNSTSEVTQKIVDNLNENCTF